VVDRNLKPGVTGRQNVLFVLKREVQSEKEAPLWPRTIAPTPPPLLEMHVRVSVFVAGLFHFMADIDKNAQRMIASRVFFRGEVTDVKFPITNFETRRKVFLY